MTKTQLVAQLAASSDALTRKSAARVVDTIFDAMRTALQRGDRIEIRGFGSFVVRTRPGRSARNPRTGDEVQIAERRVPAFKVGKELRERVNGGE